MPRDEPGDYHFQHERWGIELGHWINVLDQWLIWETKGKQPETGEVYRRPSLLWLG
jgi:hypothetical protein